MQVTFARVEKRTFHFHFASLSLLIENVNFLVQIPFIYCQKLSRRTTEGMMNLSLRRYSFILTLQFLFLFTDLILNSFSYLARGDKLSIVFVFLTQDICLILSFTALVFSMYSTYVYQAGVAELLYKKFRVPLLALTTYFLLSVAHHVWIVINHSKGPFTFQWPAGLMALFIIQRLFSPVYYYLYKRSALRMSDPRFYENLDWIAEHLAIK